MKTKLYSICVILICFIFTSCNSIGISEFKVTDFVYPASDKNDSTYTGRQILIPKDLGGFVQPAVFLDDDNLLMSGNSFDLLYRYNISADEYIKITVAENVTLPEPYDPEKEDSPIFLSATVFSDYHFIGPNHYFIIDSNHNRVVEIQNDVIIDIVDVMKVWNNPDFTANGSMLEEFDYDPASERFVVVTADKQAYLTDKTFTSFEKIAKAGAYVLNAAWLDENTIFLQQYESVTDNRGVEQYDGLFMAEYNPDTGKFARLDGVPSFEDIIRQDASDLARSSFVNILIDIRQRTIYRLEHSFEPGTKTPNVEIRNRFAFRFNTDYAESGELSCDIYDIENNSYLTRASVQINEEYFRFTDYHLDYNGLISQSGDVFTVEVDYSPYQYKAELFIFSK